VAYWLLTGRPPFEGADAMAVLIQHSTATPLAPSEVSERPVPRDLDALVVECLSKDPRDRPADAERLASRLDSLSVSGWWTQQKARAWWAVHEPELLDPA